MSGLRIPKCNLHTHTNYCDGEHSVRENIISAIEMGMDTVGFSGHAYTSFDPECSMSRQDTLAYRREIAEAKTEFGDRIRILMGLEQDYYADDPAQGYDYIIGSIHYFRMDGEVWSFDLSREETEARTKRHFGGDYYKLCRYYYELLAGIVEQTGCDIVGHFDLISKFNGDGSLFDESDPRYLSAAFDALDTLLKKDVIFEVNTGALVRGYRASPYPILPILKRIAEKKGRILLSSDAHRREALMAGFCEVMPLLKQASFSEVQIPTEKGWSSFRI